MGKLIRRIPSLNYMRLLSKRLALFKVARQYRAANDRVQMSRYRKRIKRIQREIFQTKSDIRGAKKRSEEDTLRSRPTPQTAGELEAGALPDFVIIGARKCGTTSLYHLLTQHPYVEPAASKELHYFSGFFDKEDVGWYRQCFPSPRWKDGRRLITGEATPGYLFHPLVPERMAKVVPQARLIVLLRNPVDRAYSDYQHRIREGLETRTFEEAVEAEKARRVREEDVTTRQEHPTDFADTSSGYLSKGVYVEHLRRWSAFFSDKQMLVLKSEDFFERPTDNLKLVLNFLALPDWEPKTWKIHNKSKPKQKMHPAIKQQLMDWFEPHNQRLYEYLGVDFGWEREVPRSSKPYLFTSS